LILIEENLKNKVLENKVLRYNFALKINLSFIWKTSEENSFVVIN
jgi:hypothetical protein